MANPSAFFDSNILLYADDARDPVREQQSFDLIKHHFARKTGAVSTQVLQEYFTNATRKLRIDGLLARQKTEIYSKFHVFQPAPEDILAAIDLHQLHQISFWDAMIVRAATQTGCRILYTEDLQHGRRFGSAEIVNPFL
jgi:predicted nucleic acid-binding protein